MLDFSDNTTTIVVTFLICVFAYLTVRSAGKNIAAPLKDIADALHNRNAATAEDLKAVRRSIRTETEDLVDPLARQLSRHVEMTTGGLDELSDDVERVERNVDRVAGAVADVVSTMHVPIAGSLWWGTSGIPLEERVGGAPSHIQVVGPAPTAYGQDAMAVRPVSPGATVQYDAAHTVGGQTGDTTMMPAALESYSQPPFDPNDSQSIFDAFVHDNPGAKPWDIHPDYLNAQQQYTNYEVFRAKVNRLYGIQLSGEHATFGELPAYQQLTQQR